MSERPRPGGNAGQCKPKIPRIQGFAPPGGVLWFSPASQISLAKQNHPLEGQVLRGIFGLHYRHFLPGAAARSHARCPSGGWCGDGGRPLPLGQGSSATDRPRPPCLPSFAAPAPSLPPAHTLLNHLHTISKADRAGQNPFASVSACEEGEGWRAAAAAGVAALVLAEGPGPER